MASGQGTYGLSSRWRPPFFLLSNLAYSSIVQEQQCQLPLLRPQCPPPRRHSSPKLQSCLASPVPCVSFFHSGHCMLFTSSPQFSLVVSPPLRLWAYTVLPPCGLLSTHSIPMLHFQCLREYRLGTIGFRSPLWPSLGPDEWLAGFSVSGVCHCRPGNLAVATLLVAPLYHNVGFRGDTALICRCLYGYLLFSCYASPIMAPALHWIAYLPLSPPLPFWLQISGLYNSV